MYTAGIIGAGMIAEKHIESMQQNGSFNVKWVGARRNLDDFAKRYNISHWTNQYKDILNDPEVDIVVIATPPHSHFEMFMDAVKAKKHILIEKPAAFTKEQIPLMLEAQKNNPELMIMDCSCRHARLQPKFQTIKKLISEGYLGKIYKIHHNCLNRQARPGIEYHPDAKWFTNKKLSGGGPMFDWGVYDLSFHLGILNDEANVEKIMSVKTHHNLDKVDTGANIFDVEEHFTVCMELTGGIEYYWERGMNGHVEIPNETRIYGTKGGLKFAYCSWENPEIQFFDVTDDGKGKARKEIISVANIEHPGDAQMLINHLADVLNGKSKNQMPLDLACKHLNIIFDAYHVANS